MNTAQSNLHPPNKHIPNSVPSVTPRLRTRIRRKSRQQCQQQVTNLAEHLAKQKLYDISNQLEEDSELQTSRDPLQPKSVEHTTSLLASTTMVNVKTPRLQHRPRYLTPAQTRVTSSRRVNIINYSQGVLANKSVDLRAGQISSSASMLEQQKQVWFEPVRNFTNFVLLDSRKASPKVRDALPQPKVSKNLYKSTLFRLKKDQKPRLDPITIIQLPRPQDMLAQRYQPMRVVIHSIYRKQTPSQTARRQSQQRQRDPFSDL